MSNPYFTKSGYPATSARAVSASLRAEIANIEAGFDLLPTLSGNGGKVVVVNSGASALAASKVTITEPATSATLTIADGKTLTASNTLTLAGTDGTTLDITDTSNISSGTWSPTLTAMSNCSAPSVIKAWSVRVGAFVIAKLNVSVSVSGSGQVVVQGTIPVNSAMTGESRIGSGSVIISNDIVAVDAGSGPGANEFQFSWFDDAAAIRSPSVFLFYKIV